MLGLYKEAWAELSTNRETHQAVIPQCTPIPFFGDWRNARLVTVGVNPSAREFLASDLTELPEQERRFLHRPSDGVLTELRLNEALQKCERYFVDGRAYTEWFRHYNPCFQEIGVSFETGTACHTDCVSPFATIKISAKVKARLRTFGIPYWQKVMEKLPKVEVIMGHGAGGKLSRTVLAFHPMTGLTISQTIKQ